MTSRRLNRTAEDENREETQLINRRIRRLSMHLTPATIPDHSVPGLEMLTCAARAKVLTVNSKELSVYLRGEHRDLQEKVYEYFSSRPGLQTPLEILKDEHRELCMRQLSGLVREAGVRPLRYVVEEPSKYFAIVEAVGAVDISLAIKMGVQYSENP